MSQDQLILAIDAGGTSTRALAATADGTILGHGRGGPANHILSGWDTARASITAAITQTCTAARIQLPAIACAVTGSAGVGPNGEGCEIVESLLGAVFDAGTFITDAFRHTITSACSRVSIAAGEFPPVVGAFKLGRRELGIPFTPATAAALRAALATEPA
jgi:N-acetylglucosamine kinase-like BadF-type ATPase